MKNIISIILISLFLNLTASAAFLNVTIDYDKSSNCKLDKQILKNEIYDYNPLKSPRYKISLSDYYLKKNKKIILKETKQCTILFEKDKNCKFVYSYRIFY